MPIIINEVSVIAPPTPTETTPIAEEGNTKPPGPTPRDLYWTVRKLMERQIRLYAR
jgi:hypothetical protein